jgi:hypothetical protein
MIADYNHNVAYVQVVEAKREVWHQKCFAQEKGEGDSDSSETKSSGPESAADVVIDIVNNPGGSFGGDR